MDFPQNAEFGCGVAIHQRHPVRYRPTGYAHAGFNRQAGEKRSRLPVGERALELFTASPVESEAVERDQFAKLLLDGQQVGFDGLKLPDSRIDGIENRAFPGGLFVSQSAVRIVQRKAELARPAARLGSDRQFQSQARA